MKQIDAQEADFERKRVSLLTINHRASTLFDSYEQLVDNEYHEPAGFYHRCSIFMNFGIPPGNQKITKRYR